MSQVNEMIALLDDLTPSNKKMVEKYIRQLHSRAVELNKENKKLTEISSDDIKKKLTLMPKEQLIKHCLQLRRYNHELVRRLEE